MRRIETSADIAQIDFAKGGGVVTVVTQDAHTGEVLMVAHADQEAVERTLDTRQMHYRSRTRGLWHKGATSGNVQRVESLYIDCDADALLARVVPAGPACHTGEPTCFGDDAFNAPLRALAHTAEVIRARASQSDSAPSYTRRLLGDRNLRLKKLGEEAAELVLACADGDQHRAAEEGADLIYHALVALQAIGVELGDVARVLADRAK